MDALSQLAYSYRRMAAALLRLLPERYSRELDLDSAEPLRTVHVGQRPGREPEKRTADLLWSFRFHAWAGRPPWARALLSIEHQSSVDRHMALRAQVYGGLARQALPRDGRLIGPNGELPPLLSLVLYTGARNWTAPRSLAGLTAGAPAAWTQPNASYLLLHEMVDLDADWPGNPAAALMRLQRAAEWRDLPRLAGALGETLRGAEDDALRGELNNALRSQLASKFGREPSALPAQPLETGGSSMLSERIDQWLEEAATTGRAEGQRKGLAEGQRKGLAEGQRKGLAEGQRKGLLEGQRVALRRIAARRFGAGAAAAFSARLAEADDPARLEAIGDLVAICETGGDLLRRLDAT